MHSLKIYSPKYLVIKSVKLLGLKCRIMKKSTSVKGSRWISPRNTSVDGDNIYWEEQDRNMLEARISRALL